MTENQFEPYPDLNTNRIREFLLNKYPGQPNIAAMFGSAIQQKLTNNVIAWKDLGVTDLAKQQELEQEVLKLIDQISQRKDVTISVRGMKWNV